MHIPHAETEHSRQSESFVLSAKCCVQGWQEHLYRRKKAAALLDHVAAGVRLQVNTALPVLDTAHPNQTRLKLALHFWRSYTEVWCPGIAE